MSSKYERGETFRYSLYAPQFSFPYILDDKPNCEVKLAAWEARSEARKGMSDGERLKDSLANGHFSEPLPPGYDRSCDCSTCKSAFMATYFKGLLGKPKTIGSTLHRSPDLTSAVMEEKIYGYRLSRSKWDSDTNTQTLALAEHVAKNGSYGSIGVFNVSRSALDSIMFLLVSKMWQNDMGTYYKVPKELANSTQFPQPNWAYIQGIDTVGRLINDQELIQDLYQRKLQAFHFPGPFTEAQAMMVFNQIRSVAEKDSVVVVNTNDETLRGYVNRLKRSLE